MPVTSVAERPSTSRALFTGSVVTASVTVPSSQQARW